MDNNDYLNKIHKKIRFRKIRDASIGSVGAIALCMVVFFSTVTIEDDLLFEDMYDSISYYEWEVLDQPTTEDIYEYLIEYTCIEDYDEILNEELLEIINEINLGG